MNKQNVFLLVLAVVIVAAALILGDEKRTSTFEKQRAFPDLIQHLPDIQSVTVEDQNGMLFDGQKVDGKWLASHQEDYPVATDNLIRLMNDLSQADLDEAKTQKVENFSRLGVADLTSNDSEAVVVTLATSDQTWQLIVGNVATSGVGTYIRFPDDPQSWLTLTMFDLPANRADWLKDDILDIDQRNVVKLSRTDDDGWQLVADASMAESTTESTSARQWQLQGMSEERALQYPGVLQGYVDDFVGLSFSDLSRSLPEGAKTMATYEIVLSNDDVIEATLSKAAEQYYIVFTSQSLEKYWQGWHYHLTSYAGGQLLKVKEDFLADVAEEEEDQASPN